MDTAFKQYVDDVIKEVAKERRVLDAHTTYRDNHAFIDLKTDTAKLEIFIDSAWCSFVRAIDCDDCTKLAKWNMESSHPKIVRLMVSHMLDFMEDMQYWFDD